MRMSCERFCCLLSGREGEREGGCPKGKERNERIARMTTDMIDTNVLKEGKSEMHQARAHVLVTQSNPNAWCVEREKFLRGRSCQTKWRDFHTWNGFGTMMSG